MLTLDTQARHRHRTIEKRLAQAEQTQKWCLSQLASASLFTDELDPTNPEKQRGRPVSLSWFCRTVRKLNASLLIEGHPTMYGKVVIYRERDGQKQTVCVFDVDADGMISEYSTMRRKEEYVEKDLPQTSEDFSIRGEPFGRGDVISAKPIPMRLKLAMTAAVQEILNNPTTVYDEDSAMSLLDRVLEDNQHESTVHDRLAQVGEELNRGWRTALVRLVQLKLISPSAVERLVAPSNRLSWAVKMGRRDVECRI